ncbi:MAG: FimV/HubP family polar landmark protein [Pseudomonadota bacterium]
MTSRKSYGWRSALGSVLVVSCTFIAQLLPMQSWALGLAEIEVQSALNERFNAKIELLDSQGFQPTEIVVKMASREDFDRVGVERFFFLTDLRFKVEADSNGNAIVSVTSTRPVSEPYLNFIVEVLWPSGKLLKEYTVLLDPPNFSQASAPLIERPASQSSQTNNSVAQADPAPASPSRTSGTRVRLDPPAESPSQPRRSASVDEDGATVMTTVDDTLWKIANRTREEVVSVNQQMIALQRKNPRAFIRGNINLLKAGYRLDLPSENEAMELSRSDADLEVAAHTDAWREGRSMVAQNNTTFDDQAGAENNLASQVDATPVEIDATAAADDGKGQVRIVANSGELGAASGSGEVNQLIEERAALTRQVEELSQQLDTEKELADNQVTVKDRQLEVKDQEIAQLQQQLSEMRTDMQKIAQSQNQSARSAPEPVPFWQTPLVLFGVIGVLILLLVLLLVLLRRNQAEARALEEYLEEQPADYEQGQISDDALQAGAAADYDDDLEELPSAEGQIEPTLGDDDLLSLDDEAMQGEENDVAESEFEHEDTLLAFDEDDSEAGGTETGDVIGEAEIYIAYGRYGQAANLLLGVLGNEPARHDVRLKLLETYVEANDEEGFATHAEYLLQNSDDEDILHAARELEAQLGENTVVLDDEPQDQVEPAETGVEEDSLSMDLDDLEDLESADSADNLETELVEGADDFTLEFDDELSLSDDDTSATGALALDDENVSLDAPASDEEDFVAESSNTQGDALGGDLGLDFDPDRDVDDTPDAQLRDDQDDELDALLADFDENTNQTADDTSDAGELSLEEGIGEGLEEGLETDLDNLEPGAEEDVEGFDFDSSDEDVNETKLDLASAYIDMGDQDGARDILEEVVQEGSEAQQSRAKDLLGQLD